MLDEDLAQLYGVPTKVLNQAVRRNSDRFPADFAFRLSSEEFGILKSQIVTSSFAPKATDIVSASSRRLSKCGTRIGLQLAFVRSRTMQQSERVQEMRAPPAVGAKRVAETST
jgi:hypothetical protein